MQLHGCRLIIFSHLLYHQFLYFICYLRTSPTTWTSGYGPEKLVVFQKFGNSTSASVNSFLTQTTGDGRRFKAFMVVEDDPLLGIITENHVDTQQKQLCSTTICNVHAVAWRKCTLAHSSRLAPRPTMLAKESGRR